MYKEKGQHILYLSKKGMIGASRFASINAH